MANELIYQSIFQGAQMDERLTAVASLQEALAAVEQAITAKYTKPASGIPETDLDAAVQSALAKARSAVQDLSSYYTKTEIDALLSAVNSQQYVDVTALPTASADTLGKIYLVGPDANNQYARYYTSYDGSAYSWVAAGTTEINLALYATKAELSQLSQEVDSLDDMRVSEVVPASIGKNLYNPAAVTSNVRILANTGGEYSASGYNATEFIKVGGQTHITVSFSVSISSGFVVAFYDSEKVFVPNSGISQNVQTQDSVTNRWYATIEVPEGAEYVRASSQIFDLRKFMLEGGSTPSAYEEYSYTPEKTVNYIKDSVMPPSYGVLASAAIGGALTRQSQALAAGESIELEQNSVKCFSLAFYGKFDTFNAVRVGHGTGNHSQFIQVDAERLTLYTDGAEGNYLTHGLTIAEYINILILVAPNCDYVIKIETLGGSYSRSFTKPSVWTGNSGKMFCSPVDTAFTLASLTFSAPFQKSKWLFGDSYVSNYSDRRWPYYIQNWGFDNSLISGIPGEDSESAYIDLTSALSHGKPKYLVWALGMNDPDTASAISSTWLAVVNKVLTDCEEYGITPILCTIPNVPSYRHTFKNAWIKASGYRYIDFAEAVGAEAAGSTWIVGCLATDNIHPTADGARLLAVRAIQDFPELMQE